MFRLLLATTATLAMAASLIIAPVTVTSAVANFNPTTPQPKVVGNKLTNARTAKPWTPRGSSVPSLEYACVQGWVPNSNFSLASAQAMASWGMDVVRLPLNQDCWLGTDGAPTAGAGSAAQYQARVRLWANWAQQAGLAVILDLHWTAPPGYRATEQQAMTDSQSATFWSQVAAAYKDDASVMFELFNEPYNWPNPSLTWDCWRNGGCELSVKNQSQNPQPGDAKFEVAGMQQLVNAVRDTGAKQPVIAGGLNYANDLTGWLAHKPVDPEGQLIAGWHNYAGQGCGTTCWNSTITNFAANNPVLMTEFGYEDGDTGYFANVMSWADAHNIGYLPWAWWWGDDIGSYRLLADAQFTPSSGEGVAFKSHLGQFLKPDTPSQPTTPPQWPSIKAGSVKLRGVARVGRTLTAKATDWKPSSVTLKYQWLRNGKSIKGATEVRYKLRRQDQGKKISVRVTGSKRGYVTATKQSRRIKVSKRGSH